MKNIPNWNEIDNVTYFNPFCKMKWDFDVKIIKTHTHMIIIVKSVNLILNFVPIWKTHDCPVVAILIKWKGVFYMGKTTQMMNIIMHIFDWNSTIF